MRVGLLQLNSSDQPEQNIAPIVALMREAATAGAHFVLTPEVTNCVSTSRTHQARVLQTEEQDITLAALRGEARALGLWLLIGSLALKTASPDGRHANRSFLISPAGEIIARYDKIHMFDVAISKAETFRESEAYRPGNMAVLAKMPTAGIGMTICYDLRFPALHRALAQAGADILTSPAAFSPVSGAAHWHVLLRARAIETGCFMLAPAQCGRHATSAGRPRTTYGHSLAVSPWGEVLADGGTEPGVTMVDLDLEQVAACRGKIPSLSHDRPFEGPG